MSTVRPARNRSAPAEPWWVQTSPHALIMGPSDTNTDDAVSANSSSNQCLRCHSLPTSHSVCELTLIIPPEDACASKKTCPVIRSYSHVRQSLAARDCCRQLSS